MKTAHRDRFCSMLHGPQASIDAEAHHAMLQEGGMKLLQNDFVAAKASPLAPNARKCCAHLALHLRWLLASRTHSQIHAPRTSAGSIAAQRSTAPIQTTLNDNRLAISTAHSRAAIAQLCNRRSAQYGSVETRAGEGGRQRTIRSLVLPSAAGLWQAASESRNNLTSPARPPCRPGAPMMMQSALRRTSFVMMGAARTLGSNLAGSSPRTGSFIRYTSTWAPGICRLAVAIRNT